MQIRRRALLALASASVAFAAWQGVPSDAREAVRARDAKAPASSPRPMSSFLKAAAAAPNYYTLSAGFWFQPITTTQDDPPLTYPTDMQSVAIGDVTGDNRDDIVLSINHTEIGVIVQRPDGTMDWQGMRVTAYGRSRYSHYPRSNTLADMNEDGLLDIVMPGMSTNESAQYTNVGVTVLLSDGSGGFTEHFYDDDQQWNTGILADADLDGHLDAITQYTRTDTVCADRSCAWWRIYHGDGRGGFSRESDSRIDGDLLLTFPYVTADFNNDGLVDLFALEQVGDYVDPRPLRIWFSNRAGGYAASVKRMSLPHDATLATFGDFNRDGSTDVIAAHDEGLALWPQTSSGNFGAVQGPIPSNPDYYPHLLPVDLDRNGTTDLLAGQFLGAFTTPWLQTYLQLNGVLDPTPERPYVVDINSTLATAPKIASGDINGDGCTDVVMVMAQGGLGAHFGRGCRPARAARNDFDGDHASDVLWHDATTNKSDAWKSASIEQRRIIGTGGSAYTLAATGDIDGDGRSDMLWRNRTTGANLAWHAGNYRMPSTLATVSDLAWKIVGTGDFNGDRKADVLWRHSTTGRNLYWSAGRSAVNLATVSDPAWQLAAIGDFDGDGRDDLFWRHATTGRNVLWKAANAQTNVQSVTLGWKVVGAGDFNGDAKSDVLWRSTDGRNVVWHAASPVAPRVLATVASSAWSVAAVGDYDDDGRADILWHESTGRNVIWLRGEDKRPRWVKTTSRNFMPIP